MEIPNKNNIVTSLAPEPHEKAVKSVMKNAGTDAIHRILTAEVRQ